MRRPYRLEKDGFKFDVPTYATPDKSPACVKLDLDELERREREATAGPWGHDCRPAPSRVDHGMRGVGGFGSNGQELVWIPKERVPELRERARANAALTAALRNAAPELLRRARQLERVEEALRTWGESWLESVEGDQGHTYEGTMALAALLRDLVGAGGKEHG